MFMEQVLLDSREATAQIACGTCTRLTEHLTTLDAVSTGTVAPDATADGAADSYAVANGDRAVGVERGWILSKAMGYLSPEL